MNKTCTKGLTFLRISKKRLPMVHTQGRETPLTYKSTTKSSISINLEGRSSKGFMSKRIKRYQIIANTDKKMYVN